MIGLLLALALAPAISCGAGPRRGPADEEWARDAQPRTELAGDLDEAEIRWRKEIERSRAEDDMAARLLTDSPPGAPVTYGEVAFDPLAEEADSDGSGSGGDTGDEAGSSSEGSWSRAGKATFAALTVLVTLGMMAAPYLLLL